MLIMNLFYVWAKKYFLLSYFANLMKHTNSQEIKTQWPRDFGFDLVDSPVSIYLTRSKKQLTLVLQQKDTSDLPWLLTLYESSPAIDNVSVSHEQWLIQIIFEVEADKTFQKTPELSPDQQRIQLQKNLQSMAQYYWFTIT
jgi:hypothetical protein